MSDANAPATRPYFLKEADFEALSDEVKLVVNEFITPTYLELVLAEDDPLLKSVGVSLVFLAWIEIFQQFELREQMPLSQLPNIPAERDRDIAIDRHLRLIGSKLKVQNFLSRLRELRKRSWPSLNQTPILDSLEEGDFGKTEKC